MSNPSRAQIEEWIMGPRSPVFFIATWVTPQRPEASIVGCKYSIERPNMPPPGAALFGTPWKTAATDIHVPADALGETPLDPMVMYERNEGIDWSRRMLTAAAAALDRDGYLNGRPVHVYRPMNDHPDLWMTITAEDYRV